MILLLLVCSLSQLDQTYKAGDYEHVAASARIFLADSAASRDDSVAILRLQAFSLVALGRNREAAGAFRRALDLDPRMTLDPEAVSPKIRAVFDRVRREMPPPPEPVRLDTVYARRPVPISIIIPGAGQFHNGQHGKGYALIGLTTASAAGLVSSHIFYNRAHDDYLAATEPQDIADKYGTANNWHRVRTITIGTTTVIWLYSLFDALINL
jgi:hypothetical protein